MTQYVSAPGDTLDSIARKLDLEPSAIYEANKDTILAQMALSFTLPHFTELDVPAKTKEKATV